MDEKDKKNGQESSVYPEKNIKLWALLDQTAFAVGRNRDIELKHYGLTPAQSAVLYLLEKNNGKATQNKIAHYSMRRIHSVSGLIKRMVAQGLVENVKLPNNSGSQVTITEKGREIYKNTSRVSVEMIFSVLSEEEKDICDNILKKLLQKSRDFLGIDFKPPFLPPDD